MDSASFDRLARSIHAHISRRATVRLLSGLGLAGAVAIPGVASAKQCKGNEQKCGQKCIPKNDCCKNKECGKQVAGQVCKYGTCACPSREQKCGKKCIPNKDCCTKGVKGCPFTDVCERGTCINCLEDTCAVDDDCCTGLCDQEGLQCFCRGGFQPCDSDRNCCNGKCITKTGTCACDPPGALCFGGENCCSGECTDNRCVA